jgi:hypothetical protein
VPEIRSAPKTICVPPSARRTNYSRLFLPAVRRVAPHHPEALANIPAAVCQFQKHRRSPPRRQPPHHHGFSPASAPPKTRICRAASSRLNLSLPQSFSIRFAFPASPERFLPCPSHKASPESPAPLLSSSRIFRRPDPRTRGTPARTGIR